MSIENPLKIREPQAQHAAVAQRSVRLAQKNQSIGLADILREVFCKRIGEIARREGVGSSEVDPNKIFGRAT